MSRLAVRCVALLPFVVLLAGSPSARGQSTIRSGIEFQVSTYTSGYQSGAAVAIDGQGDFVVAWSSSGQDGANYGVFARRFSSSGSPQAAEFQVNTYTSNYQAYPAVALDGDGDFVVTWSSFQQDDGFYGVFARRFDQGGSALGTELQVNSYTSGSQQESAIAMNTNGDFVVAWQSDGQDGSMSGIFARRFNAAGVAQGVDFQVNTYTDDGQYAPSVGISEDGGFVIAWQDSELDGYGNGVFARRFDAAGTPQAVAFQVNTYTSDGQSLPSVAMSGGGGFLVTWDSDGQDGSGSGIFGRPFDAAGVAQAVEFQANSYVEGPQRFVDAAIDDDGSFVVAWSSYGQDASNDGIFARRFSESGSPVAVEFQVNSYTIGRQRHPDAAMNPSGDFVVTWRSLGQDGDDEGVFAQRFGTLAILDIDGDGETEALTDGLIVLRFLFSFTGANLVAGAVDQVNCTRCTAGEIAAYLQTLM